MSRLYNHAQTHISEFGRRFEKLLDKRGISTSKLSRMIGYSQPAIHHWKSGLCEMRISVFASVVDALQLSASEIAYLLEVFWEGDDG